MCKKRLTLRAFCLIISMILLLSLLSACGDKPSENTGVGESGNSKPSEGQEESGRGSGRPNEFIPNFKEQLIYEDDNIAVKVQPYDDENDDYLQFQSSAVCACAQRGCYR
ncbi:MAG: hypothetical protein GX684_01505 [Ruminococcaceae bacterium]|nr:hypothetical protein [Oscillospiraceae bacterium]